MVREEDAERTSPTSKHTRHTSTCGATLAESSLEAGRKAVLGWGRVGKEAKQCGGTHAPSRGCRRKGAGSGTPPWGARGSSHIMGTTVSEFNPGKMSPLSWSENQ